MRARIPANAAARAVETSSPNGGKPQSSVAPDGRVAPTVAQTRARSSTTAGAYRMPSESTQSRVPVALICGSLRRPFSERELRTREGSVVASRSRRPRSNTDSRDTISSCTSRNRSLNDERRAKRLLPEASGSGKPPSARKTGSESPPSLPHD